jgi:hypothetical protein
MWSCVGAAANAMAQRVAGLALSNRAGLINLGIIVEPRIGPDAVRT